MARRSRSSGSSGASPSAADRRVNASRQADDREGLATQVECVSDRAGRIASGSPSHLETATAFSPHTTWPRRICRASADHAGAGPAGSSQETSQKSFVANARRSSLLVDGSGAATVRDQRTQSKGLPWDPAGIQAGRPDDLAVSGGSPVSSRTQTSTTRFAAAGRPAQVLKSREGVGRVATDTPSGRPRRLRLQALPLAPP